MHEHIQNWIAGKMKMSGIMACGIRSPDARTVARSNSAEFASVAIENACRCLSDTFQVLGSNRFPAKHVRWVYANFFLYGIVRPDGFCLALLTRRKTPSLEPKDFESIAAEFHALKN